MTQEDTMLTQMKTRLTEEIDRLAHELTVRIPSDLGSDQPESDYRSTVETQRQLQARVKFLRQVEGALSQAESAPVWIDRAGFGSVVRLKDANTGKEVTYTLMAGDLDLLDLDAGQISLASPVGQALLGCSAGEEVRAATPHGTRRLRVLALETLPEMLGMAPLVESVA